MNYEKMTGHQANLVMSFSNQILALLESQTIMQNGNDSIPTAALLLVTKTQCERMMLSQQNYVAASAMKNISDNIGQLVYATVEVNEN